MTEATIARVCTDARALILREDWTTGGGGWHGLGGWCIEGALGQVLRFDNINGSSLSKRVNTHPAGMAIREHLRLNEFQDLADWNDRSASKGVVLDVLAQVAAKYARQPEPVPVVEFVEDGGEKPVTRWMTFTAWFNGTPLTASTTTPEPEPPDDPTEPSEDPETPSEDLPVTDTKVLVSV